ncbi:transcription termination/antitermination NusG family protein [Phenylobacterium sp.]|uniref:transcription termination/antitermination NusG family protein n=1 Tax=Phenylobacterium sp. TaxID=1871053 RepID=UPI00273706F1|nr:transcription termination/antitermination NusG family protein [Phenylobacterium sp.]MDP3853632.1 transcription termination/antitermination NusG family protein [Phenylobacterium sp.]
MKAVVVDHSSARIIEGEASTAWIIVITKGKQEAMVKARLEAKGFDVYLPMRLVIGARKGIYPVPFFPRHLFARARMDAGRWQSIFTTVGVSRLLCSPDRPLGVRDDFINKIKAREVKGYLNLVPKPQEAKRLGRAKALKTYDDVLELIESEAIDERRAWLLGSFVSDSSVRITTRL